MVAWSTTRSDSVEKMGRSWPTVAEDGRMNSSAPTRPYRVAHITQDQLVCRRSAAGVTPAIERHFADYAQRPGHSDTPIPATNANVPTNITIGIMLAVCGNDARALCAGGPLVPTGFASICAGMVAFAIDVADDPI